MFCVLELQEHHNNARSKTQAQCHSKGHSEHQEPIICCNYQTCNSTISPEFHNLNTYLKKTAWPGKLKHKTYKKNLLRQEEESNKKETFKPKAQKCTEHEEESVRLKTFLQSDTEEHFNILVKGEELGYGEELANEGEIDWQLSFGHEIKISHEDDSLTNLLSGFCNENNEKLFGATGRLHRKKEVNEDPKTGENGKKRSPMKPVECQFVKKSPTYAHSNPNMQKDETKENKTRSSVKSSSNIFSREMFSNGFYPNHIYSNGINTDYLTDRTDIANVFPDVCDAGEALADAEGFSDCDLFENIETSWLSDTEGFVGHEVVKTGSGKNCLKSLSDSAIIEEDEKKLEEQSETNPLKISSQIFGNSQDSVDSDWTVYSKSEKEGESLTEISHNTSYSNSSYSSSDSDTTIDFELNRNESRIDLDRPETQVDVSAQSRSADIGTLKHDSQSASLTIALKSEEIPPLQMQEYYSEQKEDRLEVQGSPSVLSAEKPLTEDHLYEDTEPQFQSKDFFQSNKFLMTRSISMEAPTNRLDPFCTSVSRKHRLMLHPQSHYKHNNFLADSLPALSGSLGCLSPGIPGPPTMEIPPPFELSSITKRPIRKSTPALPNELSACSRKADFGFKRYFLPLRFLRKTEKRSDSRSSRSSSESSPQGSCKKLHLIRPCAGSPELRRAHDYSLPSSPSSVHLPKTFLRPGVNNNVVSTTANSWGTFGMEPDDLVHSLLVQPLTLSKPRSFSSPNVDSSVYENVVNSSPHYENIQVRLLTPSSPNLRNLSSANDIDGYVDMSSLPGFQNKTLSDEQETERYI